MSQKDKDKNIWECGWSKKLQQWLIRPMFWIGVLCCVLILVQLVLPLILSGVHGGLTLGTKAMKQVKESGWKLRSPIHKPK